MSLAVVSSVVVGRGIGACSAGHSALQVHLVTLSSLLGLDQTLDLLHLQVLETLLILLLLHTYVSFHLCFIVLLLFEARCFECGLKYILAIMLLLTLILTTLFQAAFNNSSLYVFPLVLRPFPSLLLFL